MKMTVDKVVQKKKESDAEYSYKHVLKPQNEMADHRKITVKTRGVQVFHQGDTVELGQLGRVFAEAERQTSLDDHRGGEK